MPRIANPPRVGSIPTPASIYELVIHMKISRCLSIIIFWIIFSLSLHNYSYARPQDKTVINAVLSDNMVSLQEIIEEGADPDARGEYGITALMLSINKYNDAASEYLIKKGADVNASDIAGVTPLHLASRNGNMHILKLLISNGADIKAKDKYGHNALYKAKLAGKDNIAQYLSSLLPQENPKDEIKVISKTYKEDKKPAIIPKPVFLKKKDDYNNQLSKPETAKTLNEKHTNPIKQIETADLEWLKKPNKSYEPNKISKEPIEDLNSYNENTQPVKKPSYNNKTNANLKQDSNIESSYNLPAEAELPKNPNNKKNKKITVGIAKFNGPEQEEKMRIRYIDDFSNNYNKSTKNNWLIILPNPKVKIEDAIFKSIYTIHNYRIKYVAVQNIRTGQKFIKAGPLVNKENAEIMCARVVTKSDYFKACNVHSINQR